MPPGLPRSSYAPPDVSTWPELHKGTIFFTSQKPDSKLVVDAASLGYLRTRRRANDGGCFSLSPCSSIPRPTDRPPPALPLALLPLPGMSQPTLGHSTPTAAAASSQAASAAAANASTSSSSSLLTTIQQNRKTLLIAGGALVVAGAGAYYYLSTREKLADIEKSAGGSSSEKGGKKKKKKSNKKGGAGAGGGEKRPLGVNDEGGPLVEEIPLEERKDLKEAATAPEGAASEPVSSAPAGEAKKDGEGQDVILAFSLSFRFCSPPSPSSLSCLARPPQPVRLRDRRHGHLCSFARSAESYLGIKGPLTDRHGPRFSLQERTDLANLLKSRGNLLFSKKDYTQAISFYTRAIAVTPEESAVFYSNRAACASRVLRCRPTFYPNSSSPSVYQHTTRSLRPSTTKSSRTAVLR